MDRKATGVGGCEKLPFGLPVEDEDRLGVVLVQLQAGQLGERVVRVGRQVAPLGGELIEAAASIQNELDAALPQGTSPRTGMPIGRDLNTAEPPEEAVSLNVVCSEWTAAVCCECF